VTPLFGGANSLPMEIEGKAGWWRVGWRQLILVVVCCVLCVVVASHFSYLTGRKVKIRPAKKANFSALITKNASLDGPNVKGWPKSPSSLHISHVLTFWLKYDIGAV
jgi:hypothetical protein